MVHLNGLILLINGVYNIDKHINIINILVTHLGIHPHLRHIR